MSGIGYFVVITKPGLTERLLGPFGRKGEASQAAYDHHIDQLAVGDNPPVDLFWQEVMGEGTCASAGEWQYRIAAKKV